MDISQRLKTASEVNAAILTSQSHEKGLSAVWYSLFIYFGGGDEGLSLVCLVILEV